MHAQEDTQYDLLQFDTQMQSLLYKGASINTATSLVPVSTTYLYYEV